MAHGKFEFQGRGGSFLWLCIWTWILTTITLGIYFPWAYCAQQRWLAKNTLIDDKRLVFKGRGGGLFGNYLLIWFLSIITLGIYFPWGFCRFRRWQTRNLFFADEGDLEKA